MTAVFFAFRDSPQRRRALAAAPGSPERYALSALDQLLARGFSVGHNLESRGAPPRWAALAGGSLKWGLERAGGYGGDFATVFASLRRANRADVVLSTVDTVGIPLMLLGRAGCLRPPLVYVAIGLPERLARLRSERMRRLYTSALGSCAAVIAYSKFEADELRGSLDRRGFATRVEFVPFGVDAASFTPVRGPAALDIVSVGADPHRDFALLLQVAARMPRVSFLIVTSADHARHLSGLPDNVVVETDIPFEAMRRRLGEARAVALPVRENSYSGATTVLLQAMALGKPVVAFLHDEAVRRTEEAVGGEVPVVSARAETLREVLRPLVADAARRRELGAASRAYVEHVHDLERITDRLLALYARL